MPVTRRKLRAWRMEMFLKRASGSGGKQHTPTASNQLSAGRTIVGEVLPPGAMSTHRDDAERLYGKGRAAEEAK